MPHEFFCSQIKDNHRFIDNALVEWYNQGKKRELSRKGARAMLETNKPEELENEENFGCVTLTDENGQEADFEILDLILYQDDQYVVLMPMDEEDDQVVILKQEEGDEENDCFVNVESEELLMTIFNIFKERNQDLFDFED